MIGAIPNPKKEITIQRSLLDVANAIEGVPLLHPKYKLTKKDDILNIVILETTEFLSIGAIIDIDYRTSAELSTVLKVEVRRKIGSFNQPHEVALANQHIAKVLELVSEGIKKPQEIERLKGLEQKKAEDLKLQIAANIKKQKEYRANNPVMFYLKEIFVWAIILGIVGLAVFGLVFILTN